MSYEEFNAQMQRLMSRWKNIYDPELVRLFWLEVKDLDRIWLQKTVDAFLGELRLYPLLPDLRVACSKERERIREIQKKRESSEANEFMNQFGNSWPDSETIKTQMEKIKRRISN